MNRELLSKKSNNGISLLTHFASKSCAILLFWTFSGASLASDALSRINIEGKGSLTYEQVIEANGLPGVGIAVVDNHEIVHTYFGGYRDVAGKELIDQNTSFNAASISKPVVATLAVMLAEQGLLNLDLPVHQYLKTWTISSTDFSNFENVTLRHLLTHTSGASHSGYSSKYLGDNIPSTAETLNTYKAEKITSIFSPGESWKYSGGGYLIAQIVLEDVTGKSLAVLGKELLFEPLEMKNTTFNQHGSPDFLTNVAKAHNDNKQLISTGIPICPEAACGLWTNPIDMAKLSLEIQRALSGAASYVITKHVAEQLVQIYTTQLSGGWGLGWMRNLAYGNLDWFSHSGYNHGTGGLVMATLTEGRGIFIFGNGAYLARVTTFNQIVSSVINSLNWTQQIIPSDKPLSAAVVKHIAGEYENLTPHHFSPFPKRVKIEVQKGQPIMYSSKEKADVFPLIHVGNDKFKVDELVNSEIGFLIDKDDSVFLTLESTGNGLMSKALKKTN